MAENPEQQNADPEQPAAAEDDIHNADPESKLLQDKAATKTEKSSLRSERAQKICCCCCKVSTGLTFITSIIIVLVLLYFAITVALYFNYYVPWWFPMINTFLVIGFGYPTLHFIIGWYFDDTKESRARVGTSFILMIILTFLLYVWTLTFFQESFKTENI